jgi:hypothetical protein
LKKNEFKLESQVFDTSNDIAYNISKFKIRENFSLDELLSSETVEHEMLKQIVKEHPDRDYLRPLFKLSELHSSDFKSFDEDNLYSYLSCFSDDPSWEDQQESFKSTVKSFINYAKKTSVKTAYLISKDWFESNSSKLKEGEFMVYGFYLLIIWVNKDDSYYYTCEWYDD